jgi:hypothetical protein
LLMICHVCVAACGGVGVGWVGLDDGGEGCAGGAEKAGWRVTGRSAVDVLVDALSGDGRRERCRFRRRAK